MLSVAAVLGASCLPVPASSATPSRYTLDPAQSTLQFTGHATLHAFTGVTHALRGQLVFDPGRQALSEPASLAVPVASLRTGIGRRDAAMRRMFEAERYPEIRVTVTDVSRLPDGPSPTGARRYRLAGSLVIRQIEQPIACTVEARVTPDVIDVAGELPVSVSLFRLKPPTVAGFIRVRDDVRVQVALHWTAGPPAGAHAR